MHSDDRNPEYLQGLLTEHYGILGVDDLKIKACIALPKKFDSSKSSGFSYWQCFTSNSAKMTCEGLSHNEDYKETVTQLIVTIQSNDKIHEYMASRQMPMNNCMQYKMQWNKLLKNQKFVCISGEFLSRKRGKEKIEHWYWIFDKYKTKNGCDSYAEGGCSLNYYITHKRCN